MNGQEAIIFDIETAPIENIRDFISVGSPPSNYKSPDAIGRWEAAAADEQANEGALDPDLCRIVAIGFQSNEEDEPTVLLAKDPAGERNALREFWDRIRSRYVGKHHRLIGFNVLNFDLPIMLRRSLYLEVEAPKIQIDRFRHPDVDDLAQLLNFNGLFLKRGRSKEFYCRRFGIALTDTISGKDIPGLAAAGEWDQIHSHCYLDIQAEAALAERLGFFEPRAQIF